MSPRSRRPHALRSSLAPAAVRGLTVLLAALFTLASGDVWGQPQASDGSWRAAAAAVVITPEQPLWMGGYAARTEPSQGKVHDLFAKVLVLEDDRGHRSAIVTLDLLGVTPALRDGVAREAEKHGVASDALLLNASHTHCGPELRDDRIIYFGIGAKYAAMARQYVQTISGKIGDAIGEAAESLRPAELLYSHARAGFAMNRRLPTASGFVNSPNPDGPVDHEVPVLQVRTGDQLAAVLFGYACHNTTLSFQKLCGDYSGFAQHYIEAAHPGTVAMFVNGCSADQNPYPRRTLELAQQHGRALANGVETALQTRAVRKVHGPLRSGLKNVTLKFAQPPSEAQLKQELQSSNKYARYHARWLLDEMQKRGGLPDEYDGFPVQTMQFGDDLILVALCGEAVVDYSLQLKKELGGEAEVWVAGYSNHVFGYLPSERVLAEGGYEGGGAMRYTSYPGPFAPGVERRIMGAVRELLGRGGG